MQHQKIKMMHDVRVKCDKHDKERELNRCLICRGYKRNLYSLETKNHVNGT